MVETPVDAFQGVSGALQIGFQLGMIVFAWLISRLFTGYRPWTMIWLLLGFGFAGMFVSRVLVSLIAWEFTPPWVNFTQRFISPLWASLFLYAGMHLLYYRLTRFPQEPKRHELPDPAGINMDEQHIVTAWDANARTMFGFTATEAIGQPLWALIIPEHSQQAHRDGVARYLRERYRRQLSMQYPVVAWDRDHVEFDVVVRISVVPQADGHIQFAGTINKVS